MKPTLHALHGFVGAGKTTFAKQLEKEKNAVRFTPDEWMCALFGTNPPAEAFADYDKRIKGVIWETATRLLATGGDVILDYGFWRRSDREALRTAATNLGVNVVFYNLVCPDEVMRKRVLDRSDAMPEGALFINDEAMDKFRAMFEPISEDEGAFVEVNTVLCSVN